MHGRRAETAPVFQVIVSWFQAQVLDDLPVQMDLRPATRHVLHEDGEPFASHRHQVTLPGQARFLVRGAELHPGPDAHRVRYGLKSREVRVHAPVLPELGRIAHPWAGSSLGLFPIGQTKQRCKVPHTYSHPQRLVSNILLTTKRSRNREVSGTDSMQDPVCELRRIILPRNSVNRPGAMLGVSTHAGCCVNRRLSHRPRSFRHPSLPRRPCGSNRSPVAGCRYGCSGSCSCP